VKFTLIRIVVLLPALCWATSLVAQDEEAPATAAAVEVVEIVEEAAAADEAAEAPADPLDAQAQQYEQMLRPKMWRELEFIRQHCDLTREQRPKIKAAADAGVKKAARGVLQEAQRGNHEADPGAMIRKDLLTTLEKTLTKEQLARYQEQAARRAAALKKTTIHSVAAQLDGYLYLSREQRDKIMQSLQTNWKDEWESWLLIAQQYGGWYFPVIPDQYIVPHLDQQQKKVWQGVQKVNAGFWGGSLRQQQAEDDWWEGKDDAEVTQGADAPKAEARPE
jgi:hypothetical protein